MLTYSLPLPGKNLSQSLYQCIREDILSGRLAAGEKLPSKRALAEHLQISKTTVENAYYQLTAEGYLCSVQGKGSFAAPHAGVDEGRRRQLLNSFDGVCTELFCLGMNGETLAQRLRTLEGGIRQ